MTVEIVRGAASAHFHNMLAIPNGYDDVDVRRGRSPRKWTASGLILPSEYVALLGIYDNWRAARILDENPAVSGVIGEVIEFTGTGPGGLAWSGVECWFASSPVASHPGSSSYVNLEFEIVDANEALEVLLLEQQTEEDTLLPDYGTWTIGTTTLTLTKDPYTFSDFATPALTASGKHYVQGPLTPSEVREIEGETDSAGWSAIRTWFNTTVSGTPAANSWYPTSAPTATADVRIISGSPVTVYTVSVTLVKIKG